MRGPKAIPNSIKRLAGDGVRDSGGRIIQDELKAEPGAPEVPTDLAGDSLTAWHSFIRDTNGMGVITKADRAALTILCETWAHMKQSARMVVAEGTIIEIPNGHKAQNPALKVYREAAAMVLRLLAEFGCTPSSRSRIHVAPTGDPMTEEDFPELK